MSKVDSSPLQPGDLRMKDGMKKKILITMKEWTWTWGQTYQDRLIQTYPIPPSGHVRFAIDIPKAKHFTNIRMTVSVINVTMVIVKFSCWFWVLGHLGSGKNGLLQQTCGPRPRAPTPRASKTNQTFF